MKRLHLDADSARVVAAREALGNAERELAAFIQRDTSTGSSPESERLCRNTAEARVNLRLAERERDRDARRIPPRKRGAR